MLSDEDIRFFAGFTGYSRARGYVRNGRVKLTHASKSSCEGVVHGLDAYGVTVVRDGEFLQIGCGCPFMAGRPVRLRVSDSHEEPDGEVVSGMNVDRTKEEKEKEKEKDEGEGEEERTEPAICPHVAAAVLVWGESTIGQDPKQSEILMPVLESAQAIAQAAIPHPLQAQEKSGIHIQVLLYWHEVLEEIRVIPRVVLKVQSGRIIERMHPLAIEEPSQDLTGLRQPKREMAEACGAVRQFFTQWPGWMADENGFLSLSGIEGALNVMTEVVPLFPTVWVVLLDRKLEQMRPKRVMIQTSFRMGDAANNDLLSFDVQFHCDQLNLTDSQLQAFIRGQQLWLIEGGRYVQVANLDALRGMLRLLTTEASDDEDAEGNSPVERMALRNARLAAELLAWAGEQETGAVRIEGQLRCLLREGDAAGYEFPLPGLPEALYRTLRPWQRTGVGWLSWMAEKGFGCVLADDMGLGKTLQALAFLQGRYGQPQAGRGGNHIPGIRSQDGGENHLCEKNAHEEKESLLHGKRPSLLLCPKSLLFNWLAEARRFVPELRVLLVHGNMEERRRLIRTGLEMDLLITTYPLFLIDWAHYRNFKFETFLLDEAQLIRNPETRLSRHVREINASFRVAMTGTPLENSALDLWSIFDFVMPGFLGNQADFRIKCQEESAAWPSLVRRVRPFMLRRTKREVLPDLPAKMEVDIPVELTQNQLALYEHTRTHIRAGIEQARSERGSGAAWIALLAGLTRLRQICDHPGLVQEAWRSVQGVSGKMEAFDTLIGQCLDGGHKVLVFSQFASMLVLLENHLNRKRIPCLRLDGQTRDRQPLIDRFNKDPDISVFLISLKAGGFGLNLTAADTVILFDPWWNPMVEEQAADRAHRFGQKRPVTIYRLIAQETIETRMQRLKEKKRAVFEAIVNGAAGDREGLLREELEALLQ